MGSKTMQVKGAGSQSFPAPAHTAPQCGSGKDFHRGQILPFGVGFGVIEEKEYQKSTAIQRICEGFGRGRGSFLRKWRLYRVR
jgi:hypothetical protein